MDSLVILAGILALSTILILSHIASRRKLPPGPKPLPLIGNILDLMSVAGSDLYSDDNESPHSHSGTPMHVLATRWASIYGPVVHINVLSQSLIFLSSPKAVTDLLEKRGAIYSDKPRMVMAGNLCGCQNMVAFTPYSPQSKRQRRLLTSAFGIRAIPAYEPLIQKSTVQFLDAVLGGGGYDRFRALTRRYAGGLTLAVVYGYVPVPLGTNDEAGDPDPFIRLASECVDILQKEIASGGGIWAVDMFPWLRHLPLEHIPLINRLPGLNFQRKARLWKAKMEEFVEAPWSFVKGASQKSGDSQSSFCSVLLEERHRASGGDVSEDTFHHDLKWTANSMYSASADTTIALVMAFIRALSTRPDCVTIAQRQIDNVTHGTRLPTLADRDQLPYISAIYTEVLRWACPVPLCLPHRLMEDDVYEGMSLPKGSLVIGNIWAILHNESIYPDPHVFKPERWMSDNDTPPSGEEAEMRLDPRNYVFGFGRRICPGVHLVESSAWLIMASILATFDVCGSNDDGPLQWEGGVFRTAAPFSLSIKPRSKSAVEVVRQATLSM